MTSRTRLKRKEIDDVLGGADAWKDADSTAGSACFYPSTFYVTARGLTHRLATCPKCDNGQAYFYQLQIRSADEPMTTCTLGPFFASRAYDFPFDQF